MQESNTEQLEEQLCYSSTANPSKVTETCRLVVISPERQEGIQSYGKWMVFRPFTQLDETWHMIRKEIVSGVLSASVVKAHCTTLFYDPSDGGPGPSTWGVIIVYTSESNADRAGVELIGLVKHDIKYKTNRATGEGRYAWKGGGESVCEKTLFWNGGKPSTSKDQMYRGPLRLSIEDRWYNNHVVAPDSIMSNKTVYGRWVIELEYKDLTDLWHNLKEEIEDGKLGPVEMVCPPKLNKSDQKEKPVFMIYTACENKESVGVAVAFVVEKDMRYELSRKAYSRSFEGAVYNHQIIWNEVETNDKPGIIYQMTLIKHESICRSEQKY